MCECTRDEVGQGGKHETWKVPLYKCVDHKGLLAHKKNYSGYECTILDFTNNLDYPILDQDLRISVVSVSVAIGDLESVKDTCVSLTLVKYEQSQKGIRKVERVNQEERKSQLVDDFEEQQIVVVVQDFTVFFYLYFVTHVIFYL